MTFKLSLKERKSPHSMERHSRFDVMIGDRKVDELYFNMTGYTGSLMNIHGTPIVIGEKGISAWKKEVAAINRDARETMSRNDEDPRRIEKAERTLDGSLRKLTFDDGSDICVRDDQYRAGVELFGEDRLSPAFFDPEADRAALLSGIHIRTGEMWGGVRFGLKIFETSDPDQMAVAIGYAPEITGKIFEIPKEVKMAMSFGGDRPKNEYLPEKWGLSDLSEAVSNLKGKWTEEMDRVVFISKETLDEIIEGNGNDFIRADVLPGRGLSSEKQRVIGETIKSTKDRPDIILESEDIAAYGDFINQQGYETIIANFETEDFGL